MAPITRRADREEAVAATASFLAKRRVHHVGATTRSDWTRRSNRGTRETTDSVRRSIEAVTERVWRGQLQALTSFAAARSLRDPRAIAQSEEAVDADAAVDAQNASTAAWKSR
jgi:hypothetical protein